MFSVIIYCYYIFDFFAGIQTLRNVCELHCSSNTVKISVGENF